MKNHHIVFVDSIEIINVRTQEDLLSQLDRKAVDKSSQPVYQVDLASCAEEYLELAMGRCTDYYERLPLVQDKALLDNILYSGVWVRYRGKRKERGTPYDSGSL